MSISLSCYARFFQFCKTFQFQKVFLLFFFAIVLGHAVLQAQNNAFDYRVQYGSTTKTITAQQGITTRDNGTFLVGKWGSSDDSSHLMVMKTDRLGRVVFNKYVPTNRRIDNYNLVETGDGGVVFAGNSNYSSAPYYYATFLFKFGCSGQLIWSKILTTPTDTPDRAFRTAFHLKEGKNGDVLLTTVNQSAQPDGQYSILSRIDGNGNIVWSKSFVGTDASPSTYPLISFLSGNKILAFAYRNLSLNTYPSERFMAGMQINYETGDLERLQAYYYNEAPTRIFLGSSSNYHFYGEQLTTGQIAIFGGMNYIDENLYFYKLIINPDLSIASGSRWSFPRTSFYYATRFTVFPNGQFHVTGLSENERSVYYFAGDAMSKVLRSIRRIKDSIAYEQPYASFPKGAQGFTYLARKSYSSFSHVEVVNMEQSISDTMGCMKGQDTALATLYSGWKPVTWVWPYWKEFRNNELASTAIPYETLDLPLGVNFLCSGTPVSVTTSPAIPCNLILPVSITAFSAVRKIDGTEVSWTADEQSHVQQYRLQSSVDGSSFSDLDVKDLQERTGSLRYAFLDLKKYNAPKVFYRLITTHAAGDLVISNVVEVKLPEEAGHVRFYPSPAGASLKMLTSLKVDKLEFFTILGKKVKTVGKISLGQPVLVSDLRPGIYLIKVWTGKEVILRKIVKN